MSEINEAGERAVAEFLKSVGDDLSTGRFALIVEAVDPEGDRVVYMSTANEARAWDTMGLLSFAMAQENAAVVADHLG